MTDAPERIRLPKTVATTWAMRPRQSRTKVEPNWPQYIRADLVPQPPQEPTPEAVERAAWQPIETAPKDGTEIVIWKATWDFAPKAKWDLVDVDDGWFGAWVFSEALCLGESEGLLGWNEDIENGAMPTHWMPS